MAVKVGFDTSGNLEELTLVLAYRSGEKIATLSNIGSLMFTESLGNAPEFSFTITKALASSYWEEIKDFRLMWVAEWDDWYEIYVDVTEDISTVKNISAKHLPEAELSQLNLYGVNINTDEDILREDYIEAIFYDLDNVNESLLGRVLSKAVNYTIRPDVPESLRNISKTLVFSFDNTTIHDALLEIAEEVNCLFDFRSYTDNGMIIREVGVYDLESYCNECGHRSEFHDKCPECNSTNIVEGFGEDTPVFWSVDNACDEISYTTDVDSVKNCFKLEAGDDIMTAAIKSCNPNGSNYIWYISDDVRENEMSQELKTCLDDYDSLYNEYINETVYDIQPDAFNELVRKYSNNIDASNEEIWTAPASETILIPVKGYPALINAMYNVIDMEGYLSSSLLPYVEKMPAATSVTEEMTKLKEEIKSVAVNGTVNNITASNAVLSMAKVVIDSRYTVKVDNGTMNGSIWNGNYTVTSNSDKTITLTESTSVTITTNYEEFVQEKIKKTLSKSSSEDYSISGLFDLSLNDFKAELVKYGKIPLEGLANSCEGVLTVLTDMGVATDSTKADLKTNIYDSYFLKGQAINEELIKRESELAIVQELLDQIDLKSLEVQKALDFENFIQNDVLGEKLWRELSSFRREDVYSNSNYISDGLSNAEIISYAKEFISAANREIIKSATLQHSISTTLKNIFTVEAFRPMLDYFKIGNWIRIGVDDKVYKLRLLSYELDFENYANTSVEFSDVTQIGSDLSDIEQVISNAKSMATSYSSIERQAYKGAESYMVTDGWTTRGLDATLTRIMNGADNQTQTWDENGMLFRKKKDFLDEYEPEQMKIINSTIAITKDNWETISTAIGKIYYEDPVSKEMREVYGVNAEVLIGKLILGENIQIQNSTGSLIFNQEGLSVTTSGGIERFKIDSEGSVSITPTSLTIDTTSGTGTIDIKSNNFSVNSVTGDVSIEGVITATSGSFTGTITAGDGKIGGWDIDPDLLYSGGTGMSSNSSKYAFWAGETNGSLGMVNSNATFKVGHNGILYATGANISGTITAGSGSTIGPWTISDTSIYKGSSTHGASNGMYFGNSGLSVGSNFVVSSTGVLKASGANISGTITATSGIIGGLNISTSGGYDNVHMYGNSIYTQSSFNYKLWAPDPEYEGVLSVQDYPVNIEFGMKPIGKQTDLLLYTRMKPSSQTTWSQEAYSTFYVNGEGKVKCMELIVVGKEALQITDSMYAGEIKIDDYTDLYGYEMYTSDNGITFNYVCFNSQSIVSDMITYDTNTYNLGSDSYRWRNIYLRYSPHVSSDRNEKKNITKLSDIHKSLFMKLIPVSFMYADPESDRTHIGFIAQDVEKAMEECGLTSLDFAGLCKDIKQERISDNKYDKRTRDVLDENGNPVYIYSLRYEEFIGIITYVLQDTVNRLDKLESLVNRLIPG